MGKKIKSEEHAETMVIPPWHAFILAFILAILANY